MASSPPLTPIRQYMSSSQNSSMQRRSLSRRSSSFGEGRSPVTRRSSYSTKRLSNASRYSNSIDDLQTPIEKRIGKENGMGNLADELDFADEDWDEEEDERSLYSATDEREGGQAFPDGLNNDSSMLQDDSVLQEPLQTDGARDSGIDVGYHSSPSPSVIKFSNGPLLKTSIASTAQRQTSVSRPSSRPSKAEDEDGFTRELEDAINAVAKLANFTTQHLADTTSRTISALQDLGAQTMLETQSHRLATSMNSLSAHLVRQTKVISSLSSSLLSSFAFAPLLDPDAIEDVLPMLVQLQQDMPLPDSHALQSLTKLDRETAELLHILSGLLDSLQMGKHTATNASRHLKGTLSMVTELRRERERAEESQFWLDTGDWHSKLSSRFCAGECKDVISGFEQVCDGLRRGLEGGVAA